MSEYALSRRSALKYLGLLAASAAGREFLTSWLPLSSVRGDVDDDLVHIHHAGDARGDEESAKLYVPQFFKPPQFRAVEVLAEMILPTDDQPGAKKALVGNYIDFVVFSAREFEPSLQQAWLDGLAYVDRESKKRFGKPFALASDTDRTALLTEMSAPERDPRAQHEGYGFFRLVKEMTVEGFYTSKVGLIDVLDYQGMNYVSEFPGCTHPEHQG